MIEYAISVNLVLKINEFSKRCTKLKILKHIRIFELLNLNIEIITKETISIFLI
jgi:hypothetical protein